MNYGEAKIYADLLNNGYLNAELLDDSLVSKYGINW